MMDLGLNYFQAKIEAVYQISINNIYHIDPFGNVAKCKGSPFYYPVCRDCSFEIIPTDITSGHLTWLWKTMMKIGESSRNCHGPYSSYVHKKKKHPNKKMLNSWKAGNDGGISWGNHHFYMASLSWLRAPPAKRETSRNGPPER